MNDGKNSKTALSFWSSAKKQEPGMQEEIIDNLFKNVLRYLFFMAGMCIASVIIVQILIYIADVLGYAAQDIVIWISQQ